MRHKRWMWAVAVMLVVVASALVAADRPPAAHFELEIERTATGIALECNQGCNWISLTGGCDQPGQRCKFVVDQRGVKTIPLPAQPNASLR